MPHYLFSNANIEIPSSNPPRGLNFSLARSLTGTIASNGIFAQIWPVPQIPLAQHAGHVVILEPREFDPTTQARIRETTCTQYQDFALRPLTYSLVKQRRKVVFRQIRLVRPCK